MAVGLQFLTKTSSLQRNAGVSKAGSANNHANTGAVNSQNQSSKTSSANQADMASMSTSDLLKHVYNNQAGANNTQQAASSDNQEKDETKPENVKLPLSVEYGEAKFSSHGKKFEDIVEEISTKTGDSKCKVESELKRKYTMVKGASVDIQS